MTHAAPPPAQAPRPGEAPYDASPYGVAQAPQPNYPAQPPYPPQSPYPPQPTQPAYPTQPAAQPPQQPERPARPTRPRLVALDLLRFIAAFSVMAFHFTATTDGDWKASRQELFPELSWTVFGQYGVDLFFVISGFVILMSVWGRKPGEFAVSRASRLLPAYWFGVTLALVVFLATGVGPDEGKLPDGPDGIGLLQRFLPNLTMMQTGAQVPSMEGLYWTLWIELHFYALIGLLVWRGVTYSRCVAFMLGWLLLGLFAQEANATFLQTVLMPEWAPYFIAGMAFFLIYTYGSNLVPWLIAAACWALATRFALKHVEARVYWDGVHEYVVPVIVTVVFGLIALVATHRLDWIRWNRLTLLGALTYPLYLIHLTVSRPIVHYLAPELNRWAVLGIIVVAALLSSYLVYRLVEKPAQRWLNGRLKAALADIRAVSTPRPSGGPSGGASGGHGGVA